VFKPIQQKEYEIMGKKVVLKTLKTKDTMEMNISIKEDMKSNDLLRFAVELLSVAIVSIEGIVPDNVSQTKEFLENQESSIVFEIFNKYQELSNVSGEELKNSVGTPN